MDCSAEFELLTQCTATTLRNIETVRGACSINDCNNERLCQAAANMVVTNVKCCDALREKFLGCVKEAKKNDPVNQ